MRHWYCFLLAFVLIATSGFCAVIQQEDFTSAQNGTLPATLDAEWDAGIDVIVTDLATMGISSDHTGGDGYVLRLADLGDAYWDFCFPANYQTISYPDSAAEAWVYFDFEGISAERDFGLYIRSAPDSGGGVYPLRAGYWLFVTANSSWSGYTPTDYRAFILRYNGTSWVQIGSEGTADYTTGWHTLRIEAIGSEIKGYVDGNLEVSGTDTEFATGFAGMVYYNDPGNGADEAGAFDNFLWEVPAPPTPTPAGAGVDFGNWSLYE